MPELTEYQKVKELDFAIAHTHLGIVVSNGIATNSPSDLIPAIQHEYMPTNVSELNSWIRNIQALCIMEEQNDTFAPNHRMSESPGNGPL